MPRMPSAIDITRETPQPNTSIAQYQPGQAEVAMQQAGNVVESTAWRVNHWVAETNELHAQDALLQLKRASNDLVVGDNGYAKLQNGAATAPGVIQDYEGRFDANVASIGEGLNPQARQMFERAAKNSKVAFSAGLLEHAMREDLNHRGAVFKATIETAADTIAQGYNNPITVRRELAGIDGAVASYIEKNGITDKALQQKLRTDALSQGHLAVIDGYIQNNQPAIARDYLNEVKGDMSPDAVKKVNRALEPQIETQEGRDIADRLFSMHVAGKSESSIFDEKLKLTEGKDLNVMRIADSIYNARVRAREEDRRNTGGNIILGGVQKTLAMNLQSQELKDLEASDPELAKKVRNQLIALSNGEAGKNSDKPTFAGMQLYAELADRIDNSDTPPTRGQIASYFGMLPMQQVNGLLSRLDSRGKAASNAKIDPDLVNLGMPKSAKDTRAKMAFRGFVENKLDEWKAQNPGKVPTLEDKHNIILSASEDHVNVGKIWNSTVEAYKAEQGQSYPKSFGSLMKGYDDDDILAAYAHAQRVRRSVPNRRFTDAELIRAWEIQNNKVK